jgi:hypothetical protein
VLLLRQDKMLGRRCSLVPDRRGKGAEGHGASFPSPQPQWSTSLRTLKLQCTTRV